MRFATPMSGDSLVTGRLVAVHGDTLVVEHDPLHLPLLVPMDSVTRFEVYRRGESARRAAVGMGVVGMLAGAGVFLKLCSDEPAVCEVVDHHDAHDHAHAKPGPTVGAVLIVGGALVGGMLGHFMMPPEWEPVRAPLRLTVAPLGPRGIALGAQLSFGGASRAASRRGR